MDQELRVFDRKYKLAIVGATGVGKTSFRRCAADGIFIPTYVQTIGLEQSTCVSFVEGLMCVLTLWDGPTFSRNATEGKLRTIVKRAHGVFVIFDVTDRATFDVVPHLVGKIRSLMPEDLPRFILVGNKIDLPQRDITEQEGVALAQSLGAELYFEVSCMTNRGVEDVRMFMVRLLVNQVEQTGPHSYSRRDVDEAATDHDSLSISSATVDNSQANPPPSRQFLVNAVCRHGFALSQQRPVFAPLDVGVREEERERRLAEFMGMLTRGINVLKYNHKGGGVSSTHLSIDNAGMRVGYVHREGGFLQSQEPKGLLLNDIAEIRMGPYTHTFARSFHCARHRAKMGCCFSLIGSERTLDMEAETEGMCNLVVMGFKLFLDDLITDEVKRQRAKDSWFKAQFVRSRGGRATLADMSEMEGFLNDLAKGFTVTKINSNGNTASRVVWFCTAHMRLYVAQRHEQQPSPSLKGLDIYDVSEVRPGGDSFLFLAMRRHQHASAHAHAQDDIESRSASVIGSERTISVIFSSSRERDVFVSKLQSLVRLIRPETLAY